jgi:glycosyl transferase family 25
MKSFIICLSKIESSLTTALNLKRQLESFNMPAELFEGTYGNDAVKIMSDEDRKVHHLGIKGPIDASNENIDKMTSPGVQGCFYSHYRLWQKCVELKEPIIIWEDDIVLKRPFIEVDWDDVLIVALGHPAKSERYKHFLDSPSGDPKAESYFQSSMPGCCGYAIKPHAAKKLLKVYTKTFLPADNAINVHHVTIEIHNYIMGKALIKKDGKRSLTRTNFWNKEYK